MPSTIATLSQSISVDEVADVVLTSIEQDAESGLYVREVRIFGVAAGAANAPLVFTLRLSSSERGPLEVTTPQLQL
jgi:hypothetical protein